MKHLLLAAVWALCSGAHAADPERAWTLPLTTEGHDALQYVALPLAVYANARRDLGDLQVRNAAGEAVPFALRNAAPPGPETRASITVPIFPLWTQPGADVNALSIRIEQGKGGAIVGVKGADKAQARPRLAGYLIDASALEDPIQALAFDWADPPGGFAGRVRVDASDDLDRWTPCLTDGPLLGLTHEGHALTQKRVELARVKAKYLRVSWAPAQATPPFTQMRVEPVVSPREAPRTWQTVAATPGEKPGEYLFDLGALAPFDRLRIELPNANAIVPVQFFVRAGVAEAWRPVVAGTVYRITQGGLPLASPDMAIAPARERYWLVRVDARGGGFGAGVLKLAAGFVPEEVVFVTRGDAPFALAYGSAKAQNAALPVGTLVPGYRSDKPLAAARATPGDPRAHVITPSRWPAWLELERDDWKKVTLWSVLLAGVVLLGWMAWRLGRQMDVNR